MLFHKVVLDTNVLISAIVFGGKSEKVLEHCVEHSEIYISDWIADELKQKLKVKFDFTSAEVKEAIKLIESEFNSHNPTNKLPTVCRDKDDNHILQLADDVEADFIITGDKDLLVLKKFNAVRIISPADYLVEVS